MSSAISISDHGPEVAIEQYIGFRRGKERLQKNEDILKKDLMNFLADIKEKDDRGSSFYKLEDPIDDVVGIKRERRVSQNLDEEAALELVAKYGLESSCLETITVLNEDGLLAANFAGVVPDNEIQALYSERESFAFIVLKES
jgi:hypothetical protein